MMGLQKEKKEKKAVLLSSPFFFFLVFHSFCISSKVENATQNREKHEAREEGATIFWGLFVNNGRSWRIIDRSRQETTAVGRIK